ncbi:hypothetical protein PanWU01x14_272900, partial [Parasponia andersonii]
LTDITRDQLTQNISSKSPSKRTWRKTRRKKECEEIL